MNADSCDDDADLWLNLKSRILQARDSLKLLPEQWHYTARRDLPYQEAQDDWLEQCARYRIAVRDSVEVWIRNGKIEEPNEQIRFFLASRFDAAYDLLTLITFVKNHEWTTMFPFPKKTPEEVLRFLLTDWWEGCGKLQMFHQRFPNEDT